MKPWDRYRWLYAHLGEPQHQCSLGDVGVDVLDADFVDCYIEATGAKFRFSAWGANFCPQLGRDLAWMARNRYLHRSRTGLNGGSWQPGFPKWVYTYKRVHSEFNHAAMHYNPTNGA